MVLAGAVTAPLQENFMGEILSRGETMREGRDDGKGGGLANAMALPGKKIKKSKVQQRPCQVLQLKEEIVHNVI